MHTLNAFSKHLQCFCLDDGDFHGNGHFCAVAQIAAPHQEHSAAMHQLLGKSHFTLKTSHCLTVTKQMLLLYLVEPVLLKKKKSKHDILYRLQQAGIELSSVLLIY